ncbi:hypothetical protein GAY28_05905 [Azospirillum brasilense]|nr:hypothetical protein [Azospirillum brasilense]
MRGSDERSEGLFSFVSCEAPVPIWATAVLVVSVRTDKGVITVLCKVPSLHETAHSNLKERERSCGAACGIVGRRRTAPRLLATGQLQRAKVGSLVWGRRRACRRFAPVTPAVGQSRQTRESDRFLTKSGVGGFLRRTRCGGEWIISGNRWRLGPLT